MYVKIVRHERDAEVYEGKSVKYYTCPISDDERSGPNLTVWFNHMIIAVDGDIIADIRTNNICEDTFEGHQTNAIDSSIKVPDVYLMSDQGKTIEKIL